jgi:hypothetical protein
VLVDERDAGTEPRMLFYLEHTIQDAATTGAGNRRVVSNRMLYVEMDAAGITRHLHYAPYLDYRPLRSDEPDIATIVGRPECAWTEHHEYARHLAVEDIDHSRTKTKPQRMAFVSASTRQSSMSSIESPSVKSAPPQSRPAGRSRSMDRTLQ